MAIQKIIHWNCNGLRSKIEELKTYLGKERPLMVSLNEIKLDSELANYYCRVKGYSTISQSRASGGNLGGGVALLIRDDLVFTKLDCLDDLKLELVAAKVKIAQLEVVVVSYYCPDKLSLEIFRRLDATISNYILCGDLNARTPLLGSRIRSQNGILLELSRPQTRW